MHAASPEVSVGIVSSLARSLRDFVVRWDRFWFKPAKPTTLGLMRICAGILLLYVHFNYTFDLQALMGKDAWTSLEMMNDLRLHEPHAAPLDDWDETYQNKSRPPGQTPSAEDIDY